jgi:hypothetical protein
LVSAQTLEHNGRDSFPLQFPSRRQPVLTSYQDISMLLLFIWSDHDWMQEAGRARHGFCELINNRWLQLSAWRS